MFVQNHVEISAESLLSTPNITHALDLNLITSLLLIRS